MKIVVFGKAASYVDQRTLDHLIESVPRSVGTIERLDADDRETIARMEVYDVMTLPAVAILRDDGAAVALWQHRLPTSDELNAYLQGA